MKEELNPSKNKVHKEIISNFDQKSKNVFCLIGSEYKNIFDDMKLNYLLLDNINSILNIGTEQRKALKVELEDKHIFFISTSYNDYLALLTDCKQYFKESVQAFYIDLEVLKALELIPADELKLNDYQIGLSINNDGTFKDYVNEILQENRYKPKELLSYLKGLLEDEALRQLKGYNYIKQQIKKGKK